MKRFYVTFGLGHVLGSNYLVAEAPNEESLRRVMNDPANHLNKMWCSMLHTEEEVERYNLKPLARKLVVVQGGRPQDLYADWRQLEDDLGS